MYQKPGCKRDGEPGCTKLECEISTLLWGPGALGAWGAHRQGLNFHPPVGTPPLDLGEISTLGPTPGVKIYPPVPVAWTW
jgi:hypothetical protein